MFYLHDSGFETAEDKVFIRKKSAFEIHLSGSVPILIVPADLERVFLVSCLKAERRI